MLEVVGVNIVVESEVFLVKISAHKSQGGTYGVPAGKLESGESPLEGARRELFEETGLCVELNDLIFLETFEFPENGYIFHSFALFLESKPLFCLDSNEIESGDFFSFESVERLPLIRNGLTVFESIRPHFDRIRNKYNTK